MADPPVHWLPPSYGLFTVCGERLLTTSPVAGMPIHPESSYRAGRRALLNGEVTCVACLAAIAARALEDADG